jgi:hypothetical protein
MLIFLSEIKCSLLHGELKSQSFNSHVQFLVSFGYDPVYLLSPFVNVEWWNH